MGGNGWPQENPAAVRHADTDEIERYQNGERQHAEERRFPACRIGAGPAHQADGQQAHAGDATHRDPGAHDVGAEQQSHHDRRIHEQDHAGDYLAGGGDRQNMLAVSVQGVGTTR